MTHLSSRTLKLSPRQAKVLNLSLQFVMFFVLFLTFSMLIHDDMSWTDRIIDVTFHSALTLLASAFLNKRFERLEKVKQETVSCIVGMTLKQRRRIIRDLSQGKMSEPGLDPKHMDAYLAAVEEDLSVWPRSVIFANRLERIRALRSRLKESEREKVV